MLQPPSARCGVKISLRIEARIGASMRSGNSPAAHNSLSNWVNYSEMHTNMCGAGGEGYGMRVEDHRSRWAAVVFWCPSGENFLATAWQARGPIREFREGLDDQAAL